MRPWNSRARTRPPLGPGVWIYWGWGRAVSRGFPNGWDGAKRKWVSRTLDARQALAGTVGFPSGPPAQPPSWCFAAFWPSKVTAGCARWAALPVGVSDGHTALVYVAV